MFRQYVVDLNSLFASIKKAEKARGGEMNQVFSVSGGKDSTAMLLMAMDRGEKIHSIISFDTGWEFPQMYQHLDLLEKRIGRRIWRLQSKFPFEYWMYARPIVARKGPDKGKVNRTGNGWPSPSRRWCTRIKSDTIISFCTPIPNVVQCVGYAADENRSLSKPRYKYRFPLKEWGVTEKDALEYCYRKGYRWGGLYEHFRRVSCFCCPLQRIGELRTLRREYPDLWTRMLNMEKAMPPGANRGFKDYTTVHDFDRRFAQEDRQGALSFGEKEGAR